MATYLKTKVNGDYQANHRWIAEKALGRQLKGAEQVHHMDEDKNNNSSTNLVICPDSAYHRLLHIRTEALQSCGNANYRKCVTCGEWDDPSNMENLKSKKPNGNFKHLTCKRVGGRKYQALRKIAKLRSKI